MPTEEQFSPLIAFRQAAYRCLGTARDARFELADAVLLPPRLTALPHCLCVRPFVVAGRVSMKRWKTAGRIGRGCYNYMCRRCPMRIVRCWWGITLLGRACRRGPCAIEPACISRPRSAATSRSPWATIIARSPGSPPMKGGGPSLYYMPEFKSYTIQC